MQSFIFAFAVALSMADAPPPPRAWCSAPALGDHALYALRRVLASDGPERSLMYSLPAVPPDSAVLVRDERTCERAARAYYRHRLGPTPAGGVAVVRIGNRYAVYGAQRAGEWTILSIYSAQFDYIAGIAM
ncbi:MAG TPA: hypothetical protein VGG84_14675 [Gemmatimonadaceae bacterium]|jgi:hypothetical protein